jgi:hypothetical protein
MRPTTVKTEPAGADTRLAPDWVPIFDFDIAVDLFGYMNAFDYLLGRDFDTLIGGHTERLSKREDVQKTGAPDRAFAIPGPALRAAGRDPRPRQGRTPDTTFSAVGQCRRRPGRRCPLRLDGRPSRRHHPVAAQPGHRRTGAECGGAGRLWPNGRL